MSSSVILSALALISSLPLMLAPTPSGQLSRSSRAFSSSRVFRSEELSMSSWVSSTLSSLIKDVWGGDWSSDWETSDC